MAMELQYSLAFAKIRRMDEMDKYFNRYICPIEGAELLAAAFSPGAVVDWIKNFPLYQEIIADLRKSFEGQKILDEIAKNWESIGLEPPLELEEE